MKNTKIVYQYCDADNYKVDNECVVPGTITDQQIQVILDSLNDGEYFIPSQVGLTEKRFSDFDPESDHVWFRLYADGFLPTNEKADVSLSVEELVENFRVAKENWDDTDMPDCFYE